MKIATKFIALSLLLVATSAARADFTNRVTLEEVEDTANYLRLVADTGDETPETAQKWCGLTSKKALALTQPLKEIYDRRVHAVAGRYPKDMPGAAKLKSCAKYCRCGVYVSLFEAVGEDKLNSSHQQELQILRKQAEKQTTDDVRACLAKKTALCDSVLMSHLKSVAKVK